MAEGSGGETVENALGQRVDVGRGVHSAGQPEQLGRIMRRGRCVAAGRVVKLCTRLAVDDRERHAAADLRDGGITRSFVGEDEGTVSDGDHFTGAECPVIFDLPAIDRYAIAALEVPDEPLPLLVEQFAVLSGALGVGDHDAIRGSPADCVPLFRIERDDGKPCRSLLDDQVNILAGRGWSRGGIVELHNVLIGRGA